MMRIVSVWLLLLGLTSTTAAQSGASITDAELEVFCSFDAPVATGLTVDEVKSQLEKLTFSEKDARQKEKDAKLSAAARAEASDFLSNVEQQRKSYEQTLRALTSAPALRDVPGCPDEPTRQNFCAAYRAGKPIGWRAATKVATCMREAIKPDAPNAQALRQVAPKLLEAPVARALTGTSLESAILRGTAEFIVERGEQELAMFASEVMTRELCNKETVKSLLSRTCALIAEPDSDVLFAVTLAALREAVRADLDALPEWLTGQLGKATATKSAACALQIGWDFSERVLQGADVAETLWDLQSIIDAAKNQEPCKSEAKLVATLTELAAALHAVPRMKGVDINSLVRAGDLDLLVSRAAPDLTDEPNTSNQRDLTTSTELNDRGKVIREVLRRLRELQRAIETSEKDPTGPNRAAAVIAALRTVEPLLVHAGDAATKAPEYITTISAVVEKIGSQQYIPAVIALANSAMLQDALGNKRVGRNFRVLITLSATIAEAESSDAVKAALEEAAAPLQSWRRKDIEQWGATITGLPGVGFAYELPVERTSSHERAPEGITVAPALMLGVDIHRGFGCSRFGLLFNVLDLGAVATIRLDSSKRESDEAQAEEKPEIRFEQVFAPGLYPYIGYGPFDFGVGVGFVPSLRPARVDDTRNIEPLNVLRFGAFVAVDVSILPLF